MPTCEKSCEKLLSCGPIDDHHRCSAQCHNGPCPTCDKQMILHCRCRQTSKSTTCIEAIQYDPIKNPFCCERRCNRKKLCGKHRLVIFFVPKPSKISFVLYRCNELCCDRDVHVCELICGKTLNCGIQYVFDKREKQ